MRFEFGRLLHAWLLPARSPLVLLVEALKKLRCLLLPTGFGERVGRIGQHGPEVGRSLEALRYPSLVERLEEREELVGGCRVVSAQQIAITEHCGAQRCRVGFRRHHVPPKINAIVVVVRFFRRSGRSASKKLSMISGFLSTAKSRKAAE